MNDWIRLEYGKFFVSRESLAAIDDLRYPCGGRALRWRDDGHYSLCGFTLDMDDNLPAVKAGVSFLDVRGRIHKLLRAREEEKKVERARLRKLHNVPEDRKNVRFGSQGYFYETSETKPGTSVLELYKNDVMAEVK